MSITVSALDGHEFGAVVTGLQPAHLDEPDLRRRLYALWVEKGLIIFRSGANDSATHVSLSRVFGGLEEHPVKASIVGAHPELIDIRYRPDDGNIYEIDGVRIANWQPWHTDLIYMGRINHGGVLRAISVPQQAGRTGFIDKMQSYARLPERLRDRIQGLSVIYKFDLDGSSFRFGRTKTVKRLRAASAVVRGMLQRDQFPRVHHPIVFAQPQTGRKILNVAQWMLEGIASMETPEGDALLEEVALHAVDETRAYDHAWREGDMVLWDNWRMLHCSRGMAEDETRHMQRTTIASDYNLGRLESAPVAPPTP